MPKVSVIIPVHCAERYLPACLESVLGQTLRDIEVICVDDGSTDGSSGILGEQARRDPRLTVVSQGNAGAAAARNAALNLSKGDYVAFMDADDLYPSADILERLYREAASSGADLCGGRMEHLLPDGSVERADDPPYWGFTTYLFRRVLLETAQIRFPPYRAFEDPPFLVAALARAVTVSRVDFATYRYRIEYRRDAGALTRDPARGFDYLRGLSDVVEISNRAGLKEVFAAVERQCRSPGMIGLALDLLSRDVRAMEHLCRLNAAFPRGTLLPYLAEIGRLAGRCRTPGGAFCEVFRRFKARLGGLIPDGVKFWRPSGES